MSQNARKFSRELSKARSHAKAPGEVAKAEGEVEGGAKNWPTRTAAKKAPETALTEAEARLSRTQAIILAEKLAEGVPCPVCGALDHPVPRLTACPNNPV